MRAKIIANQHDLNAIQESWFIQNITFSGLPFDVGFQSPAPNNKIVYLELNEISKELISILRNAKQSIILYHMGDEQGSMNANCYELCDLVIRNYFFADKFTNKVLWAPCGYKTGVGPRDPKNVKVILERNFVATFSGWIGNANSYADERLKFFEASNFCGENLFLVSTEGFGKGLNIGLYSATMESAVFAPCPAGNSPETIRLYDALELGCIPITLRHDYIFSELALGEFGQPPFAFLNSWDELPVFLEKMRDQLINNLEEIQNWQSACLLWWTNYKQKLQEKILSRIDSIPVIGD